MVLTLEVSRKKGFGKKGKRKGKFFRKGKGYGFGKRGKKGEKGSFHRRTYLADDDDDWWQTDDDWTQGYDNYTTFDESLPTVVEQTSLISPQPTSINTSSSSPWVLTPSEVDSPETPNSDFMTPRPTIHESFQLDSNDDNAAPMNCDSSDAH